MLTVTPPPGPGTDHDGVSEQGQTEEAYYNPADGL